MSVYAGLIIRKDWNESTDRDWADVLATLPLFAGIGKRGLRRIAADAEFAEFLPGDTVVSARARGDYFYVILSGRAKAIAKPAARTLEAGDYFGEMSLLDGEPRSASIVASEELHVMRLARRAFDAALERHPSISRSFLKELGTRVRVLERQAAQRTP
ncbi:MAG: cyclic nucleotide-binding domain-containing protein [Gaiellaceae bacterium]|jgi:CRP/FNR family cyclic AMP-dependent transcriptional regulator